MDVDFVHKESPKAKEKGNDKGKGKSKGKGKGKHKDHDKRGDVRGVYCKNVHESVTQSQITQFPILLVQDHVRYSRAQLTTHINSTSDPNL